MPAAIIIYDHFKKKKSSPSRPLFSFLSFLPFVPLTLGFITVFSPQLFVWKILYGSFFTSPYFHHQEGFSFLNPHLLELLIDHKIGLLLWQPIYIICVIGLILLRKKKTTIAYVGLGIFALEYYLISAWSGWTQGESFSVRMLISTLPFLAPGLAQVLTKVWRWKSWAPYFMSGVLILLNVSLIFYFLAYTQNQSFDGTKSTSEKSLEKFQKLIPFGKTQK